MADLDAELLALAGGDSSGEESMPSAPKHKSPSPSARQQSQPADTSRTTATKARKVRRRRNYSDDEESIASERSISASMSHSDSEAEFAPAEDKPIFPYEKLYYDAADKAAIQAKPEIERENILAQRSEQLDRFEQDIALRRIIASRAKAEARNKRKAEAADLDDSQRKSSRQRTKLGGGRVGEASSAIEHYKKQRAEKTLREEQRRNRAAAKEASPENDYSDADAEGESDNEFDDRRYKRRSPTPVKDDPVAELDDVQRARVGRDNFAEVCYTPGFEAAITDCYARVCIGPGVYRVCTIKGFSKGKPYAMTTSNGRSFLVDQYIMAAHGKAQKSWSFLECSMSKFTDDEWRRYRVTMANEDCKMPTKRFINSKLDQINNLLKHRFSEAEISDKIKRQNALVDQVNRVAEKKSLKDQIHEADIAGHDEKVAELEEKLANLVPMKLALNTSLNRPDSNYVDQQQEKLAELNRRNQRQTQENVRKAQLAELRRHKPKKLLAPSTDSLFGDSDISRSGTPVNGFGDTASGTATPGASQTGLEGLNGNGTPRSSTPVNGGLKNPKPKKGLPTIRKSARDDEIMAGMDLGIDIDI